MCSGRTQIDVECVSVAVRCACLCVHYFFALTTHATQRARVCVYVCVVTLTVSEHGTAATVVMLALKAIHAIACEMDTNEYKINK